MGLCGSSAKDPVQPAGMMLTGPASTYELPDKSKKKEPESPKSPGGLFVNFEVGGRAVMQNNGGKLLNVRYSIDGTQVADVLRDIEAKLKGESVRLYRRQDIGELPTHRLMFADKEQRDQFEQVPGHGLQQIQRKSVTLQQIFPPGTEVRMVMIDSRKETIAACKKAFLGQLKDKNSFVSRLDPELAQRIISLAGFAKVTDTGLGKSRRAGRPNKQLQHRKGPAGPD